MSKRDSVTWNSIISGYSRLGLAREAVELFGEMREAGLEPDEMTIVSVLGACGDLGDLNLGRRIEEYVREKGSGTFSGSMFRGLCFSQNNCNTICEKEGFLSGTCTIGFKRVCAKDCNNPPGSGGCGGGSDPGAGGGGSGGGSDPGAGGVQGQGPPGGESLPDFRVVPVARNLKYSSHRI